MLYYLYHNLKRFEQIHRGFNFKIVRERAIRIGTLNFDQAKIPLKSHPLWVTLNNTVVSIYRLLTWGYNTEADINFKTVSDTKFLYK